jgi:DNA replication protein DnaC
MSSQLVQLQEATIKQHCKTLRMPMMASQFSTLAEQAVREKKTHTGYLEVLLTAEIEERERNTIDRRIKEAHLPRVKTLEEFDYTQAPLVTAAKMRDLAEGGYIERAEPVLLIGECGTGKTHLLTGLCVAACRQKRRVRFTTAAALVNAQSRQGDSGAHHGRPEGVSKSVWIGLRNLTTAAVVPEQGAKAGQCHGVPAMSAFEGYEQCG